LASPVVLPLKTELVVELVTGKTGPTVVFDLVDGRIVDELDDTDDDIVEITEVDKELDENADDNEDTDELVEDVDEEAVLELAVGVGLLLAELELELDGLLDETLIDIEDCVAKALLEEVFGELLVKLEASVVETMIELDEVDEEAKDELLEEVFGELLVELEASVVETILEIDDVDEAAKNELLELEDDDNDVVEGQIPCARIKLEFSMIDAPRANTPPWIEDSPFIVIETAARMFPANSVPIPIVALDPTFQKTLQGCPPANICTADPTAVVRVEPI
jgi:hypothetical protein